MTITKYEHACLDIEESNQRLIIDPGIFTTSLTKFSNIYAVVVTHVHPDHLDAEKLVAIVRDNPTVIIYTVQAVADQLGSGLPLEVVTGGHEASVGNFQLKFYGGQHALIHKSIPITDNIGVMVNQKLYYPGDSFNKPSEPIDILAVPAVAPWMRASDAMDFITETKPKRVFPTHNAILSEAGAGIYKHLDEHACQQIGAEYIDLKPGQVLTV
jgi:L-ascorbate metabolism protein UlaG (beta-lactamase superfamily)